MPFLGHFFPKMLVPKAKSLNALDPPLCTVSLRSKRQREGGKGEGGREKHGVGRLGRRERKGALATKARITPCFYAQNLDVKC